MPIAPAAVMTDDPKLMYRRLRRRSKKRSQVRTSSGAWVELVVVELDDACLVTIVDEGTSVLGGTRATMHGRWYAVMGCLCVVLVAVLNADLQGFVKMFLPAEAEEVIAVILCLAADAIFVAAALL